MHLEEADGDGVCSPLSLQNAHGRSYLGGKLTVVGLKLPMLQLFALFALVYRQTKTKMSLGIIFLLHPDFFLQQAGEQNSCISSA